jgi:hypothetical protein
VERCYTPNAMGAAGSGRGTRDGKRATAVLSASNFSSLEHNASASWPQSKTSAASVLASVTPGVS